MGYIVFPYVLYFLMQYLILVLILSFFGASVYAEGDLFKGRAIANKHCSRCHVIGDINKFGGIGSTPSFQLIAGMDDGWERFQTFYTRGPHPNFVCVLDLPLFSNTPPYAITFTITKSSIADLMVFVRTLAMKNLKRLFVVGRFGRRRRLEQ